MPPLIFERPFSMRMSRVSAFLPAVTQQIHSLRASGVISFQSRFTRGSAAIALRKSGGRRWTGPERFMAPILLQEAGAPPQVSCALRRAGVRYGIMDILSHAGWGYVVLRWRGAREARIGALCGAAPAPPAPAPPPAPPAPPGGLRGPRPEHEQDF